MLGNEHKGSFSGKSENIKLLLKIVDVPFIPFKKRIMRLFREVQPASLRNVFC